MQLCASAETAGVDRIACTAVQPRRRPTAVLRCCCSDLQRLTAISSITSLRESPSLSGLLRRTSVFDEQASSSAVFDGAPNWSRYRYNVISLGTMCAFCMPLALPPVLREGSHVTRRAPRQSVIVAKKSSSNNARSKSARSKSDATSGFSTGQGQTPTQTQSSGASSQPEPVAEDKARSGVDLQSVDSEGFTLEHRLKEEIKHPLRKPAQRSSVVGVAHCSLSLHLS
ncbi:hypothetical protein FGB62_254g09 [Gracilaria domingensis]|nr:hypothetical protein FGB62_254g09 [Gracilaria domingensis]